MKKLLYLLVVALLYSCHESNRVVRQITSDGTLSGKEVRPVDTTFNVGDTVNLGYGDYLIVE